MWRVMVLWHRQAQWSLHLVSVYIQDWQVNCYQHQCIWLVLHYMSYQILSSTCPSHCWEKPYLLCYWGHFHFRKNYFKMDYLPHIDGLVKERHNCIVFAMELCLSCTSPSIYIYKILLLLSHSFYVLTNLISGFSPKINSRGVDIVQGLYLDC